VQLGQLEEAGQRGRCQLRLVPLGQGVPEVGLQGVLRQIGQPSVAQQLIERSLGPLRGRRVGPA
jgi:hypothetical protein